MKPFYKILMIVGVIVIVAVGIYLSWKKIIGPIGENNDKLPPPSPTSTQATALTKISEEKVFDFWIVKDTGEIYYLTPSGKIWSAKEGPDLEISTQAINALNFIEAAPGDQKILAAFGNPLRPEWGIFDLIDKVWRPLPAEIINATWGAENNELIAIVKNLEDLNLTIADLSKNPPSYKILINDFRLKDIRLTFVPPERLFITELPSAIYASRVWQFDLKTLALNLLLAPENGLIFDWSHDKSFAFKFSPKDFSVINQNFQEIMPMFFSTLPSKCDTAGTSTIYCFVPQDIPSNLSLPDDYYQNKFYSVDDLLQINPATSESERIVTSYSGGMPALDGEHPQYLNGNLYFINRYDNYLYELKLL